MIPKQLTTEEHLAFNAKLDEEWRKEQESWGISWETLVANYEKEMSQARADSETPKRVDFVVTNS